MKIGFFDSGIGGVTILKKAIDRINAEYIYLADNKNNPYGIKPKEACSWVTTVILGSLNKLNTDLEGLFITSKMLSEVIKLTLDNKISVGNAKKVLYRAMDEKVDPIKIIEKEHLRQIDDESVLVKLVNESLDEHEDIVLQFKEGKEYVTNYFVGQVMKKTKGQASPVKTLEIIKEEIKKR